MDGWMAGWMDGYVGWMNEGYIFIWIYLFTIVISHSHTSPKASEARSILVAPMPGTNVWPQKDNDDPMQPCSLYGFEESDANDLSPHTRSPLAPTQQARYFYLWMQINIAPKEHLSMQQYIHVLALTRS